MKLVMRDISNMPGIAPQWIQGSVRENMLGT
jgi:hypothetical protein